MNQVADVVKTIKRKKSVRKPRPVSPLRKPDDMTLEEWQVALRKTFSQTQKFRLKPLEKLSLKDNYSPQFLVSNKTNNSVYKVEVFGIKPFENYCSCPDFATNTLGTCKHLEFALRRLLSISKLRPRLKAGLTPEYSQVVLRYGSQRSVIFRSGRECPESVLKIVRKYFDPALNMKEEAFSQFEEFVHAVKKTGHELQLREDAISFIAQVRDKELLKNKIESLFPEASTSSAFDSLLKTKMYPYQREGALFAAKAGRSLIADDMGLGKTIQALAATEILVKCIGIEKVLIVTPTSLKHQWKGEIQKFSERSVDVVEGLTNRRRETYGHESFYKIVNYDVIWRDVDLIHSWAPDLIILDEAQRIKNWKTRTARSIKKLKSEYCIVLTGTPLENRLEELHSIVEFVDLFHLGPMFKFLSQHQTVDEVGKVIGYKNLSKVNESLSEVLIRRQKHTVLKELPSRIDKTFFVPMTAEQMVWHDENKEIVIKIVARWRRMKFLSDKDQKMLMCALQKMRMSCNSTYLLDQKTRHEFKISELRSLLSDLFERKDTKAVIFSQWLGTHELIIEALENTKWGHVFFNGSVPGSQRKKLIDEFKSNPACRLFLSTDAGGVGLNLQNAHVVVNMDQPWNPAILEQRIGRVHRLGQTQPVQVFNFVSKGTIEEGMLSLLSFKKSLFHGVIDGSADEVFLKGSRLNQFMDSVEQATQSIPAPMAANEPVPEELRSVSGQEAPEQSIPGTPKVPVSNQTSTPNPWAPLLKVGLDLLNSQKTPKAGNVFGLKMEVDSVTGEKYLRLPVPDPEKIQQLATLLGGIFGG